MEDLISKCGMCCSRCPAYRANIRTEADKIRTSDGWYKYLGFRFPSRLVTCDGCQKPNDQSPLRIRRGCTIRNCAITNGVETCAHCSEYPCEAVKALNYVDRQWAETRFGDRIKEEDYLTFIEPYEGIKHLDNVRTHLSTEDIMEAKISSAESRISNFPEHLPLPKKELVALRPLHSVLASVKSIGGGTYAMQVTLENRRSYFLRLLWVFGCYGEMKDENGSYLVVSSEIYSTKMRQAPAFSLFSRMLGYFNILREFGICCEHVQLTGEKYGKNGWLTPTGALKRKGWNIKMSFDERVGGASVLKALKIYATRLSEKQGEKGYTLFSQVNMRPLEE